MKLPNVTETDRAAGFLDCAVAFCDGRTETLRVFKPVPARLLEIFMLSTMTERLMEFNAHCLQRERDFVDTIAGNSRGEIFLVGFGLCSQKVFESALLAGGEIGTQLILEAETQASGQWQGNPNN